MIRLLFEVEAYCFEEKGIVFHCIVYPFVSIVRTKEVLWASRVSFFDVMSIMLQVGKSLL